MRERRKRVPRPNGRPSKRTPEVIARIVAGLSAGTPLTVLCAPDDMPADRTVRDWMDADDQLSADIARAREAGFDQIALDALAIADDVTHDDKLVGDGDGERLVANTEWISRSKLRVETRLKLLAKWDPKRYGDKQLIGSDPENPLPPGFMVNLVRSQKLLPSE